MQHGGIVNLPGDAGTATWHRRICQGGPGDTRLGAVLGDKEVSLRISARCYLSDDSRAGGIVLPLWVYHRPPPSLSVWNLVSSSLCFWQLWKAHTCFHAASKLSSWLRAGIILDRKVKFCPRKRTLGLTPLPVKWRLLFPPKWLKAHI